MNDIRQEMKTMRANLSEAQLQLRAVKLALNFIDQTIFAKAKIIASFIAVKGEQNPEIINQTAVNLQKKLLLPMVNNFTNRLKFGEHKEPFLLNKFNIPEPSSASNIPPWRFDVVLVPLTAFDRDGNRLGMGGGYYDKTFYFTKTQKSRPKLIGIAHEFQKVAKITPHDLDVPLDGILTEQRLTLFN